MEKSKSLPDSVTRVTTYAELDKFALAYALGHLTLLIVCGAGGVGKTTCIRDAVGGQACWIEGNASPFGIYCAAYENRDTNLVLDDIDRLYASLTGIRLLKCLAQTEPVKTVSWETNAAGLARRGIPRKFQTTSKVAIITNSWESLNNDVEALEDRGHVVSFEPPALEVHLNARKWFWDQEIFNFVAAHLHLIENPSLRTYVLAYERKSAGLDWQRVVLERCLQGKALEVAKLRTDKSFATEEARASAFVAAGHGCRATYFSYSRRLPSAQVVPSFELKHSEPPRPLELEQIPFPRIAAIEHDPKSTRLLDSDISTAAFNGD